MGTDDWRNCNLEFPYLVLIFQVEGKLSNSKLSAAAFFVPLPFATRFVAASLLAPPRGISNLPTVIHPTRENQQREALKRDKRAAGDEREIPPPLQAG